MERETSASEPEPLIVGFDEPVNMEWELLKLTGDHPAFCVYARSRSLDDAANAGGERTDTAWISVTGSMFSAPPRVLVTPDELRAIGKLCIRFARALELRERERR